MRHAVRHDLPPDLAKLTVERAMESYTARLAKYQPTIRWVSERELRVHFSVSGVSLEGTVVLEPSEILIKIDVPLMLRIFRDRAIRVVEEEIQTWIGRAKRGELSP
ncbi:MAG: polyhydroxyalkanoic acid system family protein [Deltaproteobacteria bacterium]|nr:polyhydroxyalkanoic acid system family protein [Deltaproteobacteria bacterium]